MRVDSFLKMIKSLTFGSMYQLAEGGNDAIIPRQIPKLGMNVNDTVGRSRKLLSIFI